MPTALRRILYPRFARRPLRRAARRPFGRLVRHFLERMVRGGQDASSSELELGAGGLLGLLAVPGAFSCLLMLDKYSALLNWMRGRLHDDLYVTSLPDKYLFLSVAMAVTGIVTVLRWDQILPDAQDYLNLAPLPVKPRRILLANAAAILIAVSVVSVAVNAIPVVMFPLFVTAAAHGTFMEFVRFAAVHAVCVALAGLFSICAVFAVMGSLSALLPREVFRVCSSWIRGAVLLALMALLFSGFAGPALSTRLAQFPDSAVRWLPSLWYLSLYQVLQHRASPALAALAPYAFEGAAAAFAVMVLAYASSYRRRFAGVLEGARRPSERRVSVVLLRALDAFAPRAPGFGRACHQFAVRALLRTETHRLVIAVSIGMGYLLALETAGRLEAPLIAAYLLILGLRVAFELPAGVPANWIFRSIVDSREAEAAGVARRLILAFLFLLVLLPAAAYSWWRWGALMAVVHPLYVLALSVCLIEILLAGYRKVPLTCPMPGFRDNALMLCLMQFLGFELFTRFGAGMEQWMLDRPWRFALLPLAMAWTWRWNRRRLADAREAGELEEGVTFENAPVRAVTRLDLSDSY